MARSLHCHSQMTTQLWHKTRRSLLHAFVQSKYHTIRGILTHIQWIRNYFIYSMLFRATNIDQILAWIFFTHWNDFLFLDTLLYTKETRLVPRLLHCNPWVGMSTLYHTSVRKFWRYLRHIFMFVGNNSVSAGLIKLGWTCHKNKHTFEILHDTE